MRRARLPHAAPEERKRLKAIEKGGRKICGFGGAGAGINADMLGECQMDGPGVGPRAGWRDARRALSRVLD